VSEAKAVEQAKAELKRYLEGKVNGDLRSEVMELLADHERLTREVARLRAIIIGTDDVHAFYADENIRIEAREIRRREGEK
jgi:anti-sigma factor RsiW